MDLEFLRALLARVEGPNLDFKASFYENSDAGNAELAKDLMAMANALPSGATERAYLLFGVQETTGGAVVAGVELPAWATDSNLHQKVSTLLNRCPTFLWQVAELDDKLIGVMAVSSGGRPYFPLRDKGVLRRHVPMVRVGSSTDVASPDQVVAWAQEDHGGIVRRLELQKLEAELAVRAVIVPAGYFIGGGTDAQFDFHFINESLSSIELTAADVSWRLDREVLRPALTALHVRLLDLPPEVRTGGLFRRQTLRSKDAADVGVRVTQPELIEAFRGPLLARVEGSVPRDALGTVIIASCVGRLRCECVGLVGGREASAEYDIRWPGNTSA
jgi:hypothetical protein